VIHTESHVLLGESRGRRVAAVDQQARSLAFDLLDTDLADADSLTSFVVAHTVAPARAAFGLPAPRPGEGRSFLIERVEQWADGTTVQILRREKFDESTRAFGSLVRSLLLFGWLFPKCVFRSLGPESVLERPGWSVLEDTRHLMTRPYEAIAHLVAGLLGTISARPAWTGNHPHTPARNEAALAELAAAQGLVRDALDPITNDPNTFLIDIGLQRIEWSIARQIDDVVRRDVRRRLVWFGSFEPEIITNRDGDADVGDGIITLERGVFAADVPESIAGLVLLDLSEQLGQDRETARCAGCGLLMHLTGHQRSRARLRQPVYHPDCRTTERLRYFRRKSRERYHQTRLAVVR
jgi:hypothetical protein